MSLSSFFSPLWGGTYGLATFLSEALTLMGVTDLHGDWPNGRCSAEGCFVVLCVERDWSLGRESTEQMPKKWGKVIEGCSKHGQENLSVSKSLISKRIIKTLRCPAMRMQTLHGRGKKRFFSLP